MLTVFGGDDDEERKPAVPTEIEVKNRAVRPSLAPSLELVLIHGQM